MAKHPAWVAEWLEPADAARLHEAITTSVAMLGAHELIIAAVAAATDGAPGLAVLTATDVLFVPESTGEPFRATGPFTARLLSRRASPRIQLVADGREITLDGVHPEDLARELVDVLNRPAPSPPPPTELQPTLLAEFSDDPDAAFKCPQCGAEYSMSYSEGFCLDCKNRLVTRDQQFVPVDDRPAVEDDDDLEDFDDSLDVIRPFNTANPFLQRLFLRQDFGRVPARAVTMFREISPDAEEQLLTALRTRHGAYRRGYLLITTHWLRWVQTVPTRDDDFWPFDYALEIDGGPLDGGVIRAPEGQQFQVRWGKAKAFGEFYRLARQAMTWEVSHPEPPLHDAPAEPGGSDLVSALERLAALQQSGLLTDDEFAAAKASLLTRG